MKSKSLIRKITIIAIILMILFVLILSILKNKANNDNKTNEYKNKVVSETIDKNNEKKLDKVKSATAFFTVQSCVNKYITYVSQRDSHSVYKILDNQYIQKHKVTQGNILDKIEDIPNQSIFEATEMYVEEIDENNNKYYVSGVLKKEDMLEKTILNDNFKTIVVLDFENMIFSVIPLEDGGVFDEE